MSCLDMEREHIENVIKMHAEVGKNGYSPYIDEITGTWFVFDDISRKYIETNIKARGANSWEDIDGKPESFPPSEHNHDDRYYTGQEVDMQMQNLRNEIPSLDGYATESWVENKGYVTSEHNHDDRYYTAQDVDMQMQNLGMNLDMQMQNLRNEIPSLDGYATESWVDGNFVTYRDLSGYGYATEYWVESKGYVREETLNRQYELIEEITLTENVDSIARSTDTQGNAYNFKSVIIYAQLAANTENSTLRVYVNGLTDASIWAQNAISTGARYDKMEISCNGGVISATNINGSNLSGTSGIVSTPLLAIGHSAITSFNITSTKGIPSGSTIKIYGVRA